MATMRRCARTLETQHGGYALTFCGRFQTRLHALNSLSDLIRISASPLRPLAQQLQIISVTLLCQWSSGAAFAAGQEAAARLLGSVYITAGKAQAGQGWRRTVESLAGSSHQLISVIASTLVEGEPLLLSALSPRDVQADVRASQNTEHRATSPHWICLLFRRLATAAQWTTSMLCIPHLTDWKLSQACSSRCLREYSRRAARRGSPSRS